MADNLAGIARRLTAFVPQRGSRFAQDEVGGGKIPVMRVRLDEGRVERCRRRPSPGDRRARECRTCASAGSSTLRGSASIIGFGPAMEPTIPARLAQLYARHSRNAPCPGQRPVGLVCAPGIRARRQSSCPSSTTATLTHQVDALRESRACRRSDRRRRCGARQAGRRCRPSPRKASHSRAARRAASRAG